MFHLASKLNYFLFYSKHIPQDRPPKNVIVGPVPGFLFLPVGEMIDYPTLGALLSAIEMILRAVPFKFEAAEADTSGEFLDFANRQFDDLDDPWDDILTEILTFLPYGFAVMEMVFKKTEDVFQGRLPCRAKRQMKRFSVARPRPIRSRFLRAARRSDPSCAAL